MKIMKYREFFHKAVRFTMVGLLGTVVYAVLALTFTRVGLPIMHAHTVALIISLSVSYAGQKIITFGIRGDHRRSGPRFFLATALIVFVQYTIVYLLNKTPLSNEIIVLISTVYYPPASFFIHNFWTFKLNAD